MKALITAHLALWATLSIAFAQSTAPPPASTARPAVVSPRVVTSPVITPPQQGFNVPPAIGNTSAPSAFPPPPAGNAPPPAGNTPSPSGAMPPPGTPVMPRANGPIVQQQINQSVQSQFQQPLQNQNVQGQFQQPLNSQLYNQNYNQTQVPTNARVGPNGYRYIPGGLTNRPIGTNNLPPWRTNYYQRSGNGYSTNPLVVPRMPQ